MSTWLFVGPTLGPDGLPTDAAIRVRPPAAAGDVYAAVLDGASRIAIVDGFWGDRPSVRHKEILWAMKRGVPVLGAASMGALRAAELTAFGMIGVGRIFRLYAAGELTRDADVAVIHAPAELGWQPLSLAVVDVEARLRRGSAMAGASIDEARLTTWIDAVRAVPLRERSGTAVLDRLRRLDPSQRPSAEVLAWLAEDSFSLKRADAQLLVRRLAFPSPPPRALVVPEDCFHAAALAAAERSRCASARQTGRAQPFPEERLVTLRREG